MIAFCLYVEALIHTKVIIEIDIKWQWHGVHSIA